MMYDDFCKIKVLMNQLVSSDKINASKIDDLVRNVKINPDYRDHEAANFKMLDKLNKPKLVQRTEDTSHNNMFELFQLFAKQDEVLTNRKNNASYYVENEDNEASCTRINNYSARSKVPYKEVLPNANQFNSRTISMNPQELNNPNKVTKNESIVINNNIHSDYKSDGPAEFGLLDWSNKKKLEHRTMDMINNNMFHDLELLSKEDEFLRTCKKTNGTCYFGSDDNDALSALIDYATIREVLLNNIVSKEDFKTSKENNVKESEDFVTNNEINPVSTDKAADFETLDILDIISDTIYDDMQLCANHNKPLISTNDNSTSYSEREDNDVLSAFINTYSPISEAASSEIYPDEVQFDSVTSSMNQKRSNNKNMVTQNKSFVTNNEINLNSKDDEDFASLDALDVINNSLFDDNRSLSKHEISMTSINNNNSFNLTKEFNDTLSEVINTYSPISEIATTELAPNQSQSNSVTVSISKQDSYNEKMVIVSEYIVNNKNNPESNADILADLEKLNAPKIANNNILDDIKLFSIQGESLTSRNSNSSYCLENKDNNTLSTLTNTYPPLSEVPLPAVDANTVNTEVQIDLVSDLKNRQKPTYKDKRTELEELVINNNINLESNDVEAAVFETLDTFDITEDSMFDNVFAEQDESLTTSVKSVGSCGSGSEDDYPLSTLINNYAQKRDTALTAINGNEVNFNSERVSIKSQELNNGDKQYAKEHLVENNKNKLESGEYGATDLETMNTAMFEDLRLFAKGEESLLTSKKINSSDHLQTEDSDNLSTLINNCASESEASLTKVVNNKLELNSLVLSMKKLNPISIDKVTPDEELITKMVINSDSSDNEAVDLDTLDTLDISNNSMFEDIQLFAKKDMTNKKNNDSYYLGNDTLCSLINTYAPLRDIPLTDDIPNELQFKPVTVLMGQEANKKNIDTASEIFVENNKINLKSKHIEAKNFETLHTLDMTDYIFDDIQLLAKQDESLQSRNSNRSFYLGSEDIELQLITEIIAENKPRSNNNVKLTANEAFVEDKNRNSQSRDDEIAELDSIDTIDITDDNMFDDLQLFRKPGDISRRMNNKSSCYLGNEDNDAFATIINRYASVNDVPLTEIVNDDIESNLPTVPLIPQELNTETKVKMKEDLLVSNITLLESKDCEEADLATLDTLDLTNNSMFEDLRSFAKKREPLITSVKMNSSCSMETDDTLFTLINNYAPQCETPLPVIVNNEVEINSIKLSMNPQEPNSEDKDTTNEHLVKNKKINPMPENTEATDLDTLDNLDITNDSMFEDLRSFAKKREPLITSVKTNSSCSMETDDTLFTLINNYAPQCETPLPEIVNNEVEINSIKLSMNPQESNSEDKDTTNEHLVKNKKINPMPENSEATDFETLDNIDITNDSMFEDLRSFAKKGEPLIRNVKTKTSCYMETEDTLSALINNYAPHCETPLPVIVANEVEFNLATVSMNPQEPNTEDKKSTNEYLDKKKNFNLASGNIEATDLDTLDTLDMANDNMFEDLPLFARKKERLITNVKTNSSCSMDTDGTLSTLINNYAPHCETPLTEIVVHEVEFDSVTVSMNPQGPINKIKETAHEYRTNNPNVNSELGENDDADFETLDNLDITNDSMSEDLQSFAKKAEPVTKNSKSSSSCYMDTEDTLSTLINNYAPQCETPLTEIVNSEKVYNSVAVSIKPQKLNDGMPVAKRDILINSNTIPKSKDDEPADLKKFDLPDMTKNSKFKDFRSFAKKSEPLTTNVKTNNSCYMHSEEKKTLSTLINTYAPQNGVPLIEIAKNDEEFNSVTVLIKPQDLNKDKVAAKAQILINTKINPKSRDDEPADLKTLEALDITNNSIFKGLRKFAKSSEPLSPNIETNSCNMETENTFSTFINNYSPQCDTPLTEIVNNKVELHSGTDAINKDKAVAQRDTLINSKPIPKSKNDIRTDLKTLDALNMTDNSKCKNVRSFPKKTESITTSAKTDNSCYVQRIDKDTLSTITNSYAPLSEVPLTKIVNNEVEFNTVTVSIKPLNLNIDKVAAQAEIIINNNINPESRNDEVADLNTLDARDMTNNSLFEDLRKFAKKGEQLTSVKTNNSCNTKIEDNLSTFINNYAPQCETSLSEIVNNEVELKSIKVSMNVQVPNKNDKETISKNVLKTNRTNPKRRNGDVAHIKTLNRNIKKNLENRTLDITNNNMSLYKDYELFEKQNKSLQTSNKSNDCNNLSTVMKSYSNQTEIPLTNIVTNKIQMNNHSGATENILVNNDVRVISNQLPDKCTPKEQIPPEEYSCKLCDYKCYKHRDLGEHLRTHNVKRPFVCKICDYSSRFKSSLRRHMRIHTGEKPFSCKLCDYACNQKHSLVVHMKSHTKEKSFSCTLCDYACKEKYNLDKHMRVHTGEKHLSCKLCEYTCRDGRDLGIHMVIHDGDKPHACKICDFTCRGQYELNKHVRLHTGDKPFACTMCDYASRDKSNLASHMRIHATAKTYTCKFCGHASRNKSHLNSHMKTHANEKPFSCKLCDYASKDKSNLTKHMKVHTGDKPFTCKFCDYTSKHKTNLVSHMRTHTGDKPFSCKFCNYSCSQRSSLTKHMAVHNQG